MAHSRYSAAVAAAHPQNLTFPDGNRPPGAPPASSVPPGFKSATWGRPRATAAWGRFVGRGGGGRSRLPRGTPRKARGRARISGARDVRGGNLPRNSPPRRRLHPHRAAPGTHRGGRHRCRGRRSLGAAVPIRRAPPSLPPGGWGRTSPGDGESAERPSAPTGAWRCSARVGVGPAFLLPHDGAQRPSCGGSPPSPRARSPPPSAALPGAGVPRPGSQPDASSRGRAGRSCTACCRGWPGSGRRPEAGPTSFTCPTATGTGSTTANRCVSLRRGPHPRTATLPRTRCRAPGTPPRAP